MELTKEQNRRLQQLIDKCLKIDEDSLDIYQVMNSYKCYLNASNEVRDYVYSVVVAGLYGEDIDEGIEVAVSVESTEIEELNNKIHKLENENIELKEYIHKLENENRELTIKSKRGGRKAKFNDADIEAIKMYRMQGKTIKEIADIYCCSVGLVHKLVCENRG